MTCLDVNNSGSTIITGNSDFSVSDLNESAAALVKCICHMVNLYNGKVLWFLKRSCLSN